MTAEEIHQRLLDRFGSDVIVGTNFESISPWIEVAPASIRDVGGYLRTDDALEFDALNDLCAVDYLEPDPKQQAKFGHEPHLEVVYQLYSYSKKHHLTVKVKLPRWKDDVPGELPEMPSTASIWRIAEWHEREAYDLFGIRFLDNPNLTRILCPDDWVGHPMRKDYEFPLEYHGIRGR